MYVVIVPTTMALLFLTLAAHVEISQFGVTHL